MIFAIEKVPFKSQAFLGDFQGQAGGKNLRGINPKFFVEFSSIKSEFFQKIPFEKFPSFVKNKGDPIFALQPSGSLENLQFLEVCRKTEGKPTIP